MSPSKFNAEGYFDPTAYAAMTIMEQEARRAAFRPLVFICSPFAGEIAGNIRRACGYCRFAVSQNAIPIAPHLLFPQFMDDDDKAQRTLAIFMGLVLLTKCQELWCFGDRITSGMSQEINKAKKRCIVIRHFNSRCEEVQKIETTEHSS